MDTIRERDTRRIHPVVLASRDRWAEYEHRKKALRRRGLPWHDYERALRAIAAELGL